MKIKTENGKFYSAHTHWARAGKDLGNGVETVGGHHSELDLKLPGYSTVIGRASSTYFIDINQGYQPINPDPFMRFFLFQA